MNKPKFSTLCEVVLTLLFLLGCSAPPQTGQPATLTPPLQEPSLTARPTETATSTPQPALDERPLIFFSPLPAPIGSLDFMDLFTPQAPWAESARRVHVFELYGGWVAHFPWEPPEATDAELKQIVDDLNRRGMAIAFGASPLVATEVCGRGIEGFFGPEEGLAIVRKLKSLGAEVRYVALDEPFAFGHIYSGKAACQWPAEKIALQVRDYISALHTVYPEAIIGDDEPLWQGVDPQELIGWLDAYKAATGENLPFLHLDLDFTRSDWAEAAKQIEVATKARGVEFGIFYFGNQADATDAEWVEKAFERAARYELQMGGQPDHIIFASWHPRPDAVLPETKADTFTGLLRRYFLPRPKLTASEDTSGGAGVSGTLTDPAGSSLAGVPIQGTLKSLDEAGLAADYILEGTVPAGASLANVGLRVNLECGCQGESDFNFYGAAYLEGDESNNRVPNSNFRSGLGTWGNWGNAAARLKTSDLGSGVMLHVQAAPEQDLGMNSNSFPVRPGSTFRVTFSARVSAKSSGSGYFALFFMSPQGEISRLTIPIGPGSRPMGETTTDAQGEYNLRLEGMPAGNYLLEVEFPGDERYFPAWNSVEVVVP